MWVEEAALERWLLSALSSRALVGMRMSPRLLPSEGPIFLPPQ